MGFSGSDTMLCQLRLSVKYIQPNIPGEILCNVNRYFWCLPADRQDGGYKDCDSILNSHAVFWNVLNLQTNGTQNQPS